MKFKPNNENVYNKEFKETQYYKYLKNVTKQNKLNIIQVKIGTNQKNYPYSSENQLIHHYQSKKVYNGMINYNKNSCTYENNGMSVAKKEENESSNFFSNNSRIDSLNGYYDRSFESNQFNSNNSFVLNSDKISHEEINNLDNFHYKHISKNCLKCKNIKNSTRSKSFTYCTPNSNVALNERIPHDPPQSSRSIKSNNYYNLDSNIRKRNYSSTTNANLSNTNKEINVNNSKKTSFLSSTQITINQENTPSYNNNSLKNSKNLNSLSNNTYKDEIIQELSSENADDTNYSNLNRAYYSLIHREKDYLSCKSNKLQSAVGSRKSILSYFHNKKLINTLDIIEDSMNNNSCNLESNLASNVNNLKDPDQENNTKEKYYHDSYSQNESIKKGLNSSNDCYNRSSISIISSKKNYKSDDNKNNNEYSNYYSKPLNQVNQRYNDVTTYYVNKLNKQNKKKNEKIKYYFKINCKINTKKEIIYINQSSSDSSESSVSIVKYIEKCINDKADISINKNNTRSSQIGKQSIKNKQYDAIKLINTKNNNSDDIHNNSKIINIINKPKKNDNSCKINNVTANPDIKNKGELNINKNLFINNIKLKQVKQTYYTSKV